MCWFVDVIYLFMGLFIVFYDIFELFKMFFDLCVDLGFIVF